MVGTTSRITVSGNLRSTRLFLLINVFFYSSRIPLFRTEFVFALHLTSFEQHDKG